MYVYTYAQLCTAVNMEARWAFKTALDQCSGMTGKDACHQADSLASMPMTHRLEGDLIVTS